MIWFIIIIALILVSLETIGGKVVFGAIVLALGMLLLGWIADIDFLFTIAKWCAIVMVVTITGGLLLGIFKM